MSTQILCILPLFPVFSSPQAFYAQFGRLPKLEDLTDVYNIPDKTDSAYQGKIDVLLWYVDIYLVAVAGLALYGKVDRCYKIMSQAADLQNKKLKVPMVPVEAEAFGWLVFKNCEEKWQVIVPKKAKNARWSIPKFSKNDSSTHQYHNTKWTDPKTGKDQGGGWDTSAYPVSSYIQTVQKIREDDKKNGFPVQKMCLAMICDKHGITDEQRPKKRRRRVDKKPKLAPAQEMNFVLQVKDEFDDTAVDVKVGVDGTERGNL